MSRGLRIRDPEALAAVAEAERIVRAHGRRHRNTVTGWRAALQWMGITAEACLAYCSCLALWEPWML